VSVEGGSVEGGSVEGKSVFSSPCVEHWW